MLYAEAGLECGDEDLYDIGIPYLNDPNECRKIVKRYINALLNDRSGKYRLSPTQLKELGISARDLFNAVCKRHESLLDHFHSGVGLRLQCLDSRIAEQVMLHFVAKKEVCLPVHDSFIVRRGLESELKATMMEAFFKLLGKLPKVKSTSGYNNISFLVIDKELARSFIAEALTKHFEDHSIMLSYHSSWEQATYSKQDIILRDRHFQLSLNR
jgi:hypothetical protein